MPPLRFTLSVGGDVQLDRVLEAIPANASQIDHVLHEIGRDLRKVETEQFRSQGVYGSGGWAALTDKYRQRKQKLVAAGKVINGRQARYLQIMRLTDRLRQSLVYKTDPEHVEFVFDHVLTWGTLVPYADVHQNPQHGQTQRRVVELPRVKREQYLRAILQYVRTGNSGL